MKSVRIRCYSGPHFPTFGLNTERYGVSKYLVQMPENADQNNSEYEHFSSSEAYISEATVNSMKKLQKQPPGGVLKKSVLMQLTYRRTPMPKCDFNKIAK